MSGQPGPALTCQDVIGMLVDYLESALRPAAVATFEAHLGDCQECVAYVNTYQKTRDLTGRVGRVEMPEEMRARLRALLARELGAHEG